MDLHQALSGLLDQGVIVPVAERYWGFNAKMFTVPKLKGVNSSHSGYQSWLSSFNSKHVCMKSSKSAITFPSTGRHPGSCGHQMPSYMCPSFQHINYPSALLCCLFTMSLWLCPLLSTSGIHQGVSTYTNSVAFYWHSHCGILGQPTYFCSNCLHKLFLNNNINWTWMSPEPSEIKENVS